VAKPRATGTGVSRRASRRGAAVARLSYDYPAAKAALNQLMVAT